MNALAALDGRREAAEVWPLAHNLMNWLAPHCERIEVGGSLRRGRQDVKDVELIVLEPKPSYFAELDAAVERGTLAKKRYGDKQTTRWGEKYRGVVYQGVTFELFCCDWDNCGYVSWLRTGPGDANQFLVTEVKYRCKTWMLDKGYVWTRSQYDMPEHKLSVKTEADFFALCGLRYIEPHQRTEALYKSLLRRKEHVWGDVSEYLIQTPARVTEAAQATLFDAPEPVALQDADAQRGRKTPPAPSQAQDAPSWLTLYSERRREEETRMRELLDQLTHDATRVTLVFDGAWHVERADDDGVYADAAGDTLMDALNRAIPAYRRARSAADEVGEKAR